MGGLHNRSSREGVSKLELILSFLKNLRILKWLVNIGVLMNWRGGWFT